MSLKGKNVFLSGPMSGVGHWNVDGFALAHEKVKAAGAADVYDPAVEYLTKGSAKEPHEKCMRRTLNELTRPKALRTMLEAADDSPFYDAIVMLPGWERSIGAKLEMDVAISCGIKVVMLQDVEPLGDEPTIVGDAIRVGSVKIPDSWLNVTSCCCDKEKE